MKLFQTNQSPFLILSFVLFCTSCVNYSKMRLMDEFAYQKQHKDKVQEKKNYFELNNKTYLMPAKIELTFNDSTKMKGVVLKNEEEFLYVQDNRDEYYKKVSKNKIMNSKVFSLELNIDKSKNVEVFFSPNEVEREYSIMTFYHWKFFTLPPFSTQKSRIQNKSIYKHWLNAVELHGDAVIIDPSLLNSTVIVYVKNEEEVRNNQELKDDTAEKKKNEESSIVNDPGKISSVEFKSTIVSFENIPKEMCLKIKLRDKTVYYGVIIKITGQVIKFSHCSPIDNSLTDSTVNQIFKTEVEQITDSNGNIVKID